METGEVTIGGFPAKKVSLIALIELLIHASLNLAGYYQAGYQLVSPLIPREIIDQLATPYLKIAVIGFIVLFIAWLLHCFSRYRSAFIISIIGIVVSETYVALTMR